MGAVRIGFDLVASKRDRSYSDDAPQQVPMRPAPAAIKRNPGTDEKKARRQQARKTAGLSPQDAQFLYQHALDYAKGDAAYAAWYMSQYGGADSLEDVPDHPDAMADYQAAVAADGGQDAQQPDQQAPPDPQQQPADKGGNPFAKKESRMTTEADLLAKMASARTPSEQQGYARDLEALRAQRVAAHAPVFDFEAASHVESGREFLLPSEPSHTGVGVTAATDWLGDVDTAPAAPLAAVEARMRAEAITWFDSRHEAVKADIAELGAQAVGYGRRVASTHGAHAEAAWQAFAAQVEHLHDGHLRRQAMDEVQKPPYVAPVNDYKIPDNPDTFDDSLTAGADPKSTSQTSAAPSLAEGSEPEGDHAEGVDNPAAANTHSTNGPTEATDYLDGTKTPNSNGKGETFSSLRLTAEGDPKSPAQTSAAPSLAEGDAPEGDHAEPAVVDLLSGDHDRSGGDAAAIDSLDGTVYPKQSLRQIAASIAADEARVGRQVHPAARPFLAAMGHLDTCADAFAGVAGRDVVAHFLRTTALHGPQADAHLADLQRHLAGEVPEAFKKNWGKGGDDDSDDGDDDAEVNSQHDSDDDSDASESGDDEKPWEKAASLVAMDASSPSGQHYARVSLPPAEALRAGKALVAQALRALGGQTCKVCGDPIERDPAGEDNRSWHHTDSGTHDHEAQPSGDGDAAKESRKQAAEYSGGSPKEGDTARCHKDGGAIQFFDGQWMHLAGTGDSHNDVYPPNKSERNEVNSSLALSPAFAARVQASLR